MSSAAVDHSAVDALRFQDDENWSGTVFDIVSSIRDPEKPNSLGELDVVRQDLVDIRRREGGERRVVRIGLVPTVPHCSLATLIGLCVRTKLERELPREQFKVDLYLVPGSHQSAEEITKQINDKERVAAAMENPNLRQTVTACIRDGE